MSSTTVKVEKCNTEGARHLGCSVHEKVSRPGWCHGRNPNGTICGVYFDWTPPDRQLCATHRRQVDPNEPCYFLKLPTELRQEIFRYLMPTRPIDTLVVYNSATACNHLSTGVPGSFLRTMLSTPLLGLLLGFNREVYKEVKDVFYKAATFTIDVSRGGATLCGRRILAPRGPDGHPCPRDDQRAIDRFIQNFAWSEVRNYSIRIEMERGCIEGQFNHRVIGSRNWSEEVDMYDLREYVAVVVSGVLAKARQLCNLQVRVLLNQPNHWFSGRMTRNTKLIIGPFERLRNVREPQFVGVFQSQLSEDLYGHRHRASNDTRNRCVTPPPRDSTGLFAPHVEGLDLIAAEWQSCLIKEAPFKIIPKSPMTQLFVEFKTFYLKLVQIMPHISKTGRHCPLHRARVARENEDIEAFRAIQAELLEAWNHRVRLQQLERQEVDAVVQRMMGADTYPPTVARPLPPPSGSTGEERYGFQTGSAARPSQRSYRSGNAETVNQVR